MSQPCDAIVNAPRECLECGHLDWDGTHIFTEAKRCEGCERCAPEVE